MQNYRPSIVTLSCVVVTLIVSVTSQAQDLNWSIAGALIEGRHVHQTQVLPNGNLLVMGGIVGSTRYVDGGALDGTSTANCEIFDPVARTTVRAQAMNSERSEFPSIVTPIPTP